MDIKKVVETNLIDGVPYWTFDDGSEMPVLVGGVAGPPGPQGEPGPQGPPGTGGGAGGTFVTLDRTVQMVQTGSLPDGSTKVLDYADAKVVCQGYHVPGGLSWLSYVLAMTGPFIDGIPDVDLASSAGSEFRWRLPWPVLPGFRGYFTYPGGIYYADHPRTMPCVGGIETFLDPADSKAYCWAYLRVDMHWALADPGHYGEEKGALNRRRPFLKWTPGSWIKFSLHYLTE